MNNIPLILNYIIPGYIFLFFFNWSFFYNGNTTPHETVLKSITISYLLETLYSKIFDVSLIDINDVIVICCTAIILGLGFGFILRSKKFNNLLSYLHIDRSTNKNICVDAITSGTYIRIYMNDGYSYQGQCYLLDENSLEPTIILIHWQKLNSNLEVVIDNYKKEKQLLAVNTKNSKLIELIRP